MFIDFSPSGKTLAKMRKIHQLRKKKVIWTDVAKQLGHGTRYVKALEAKYKEILAEAKKK